MWFNTVTKLKEEWEFRPSIIYGLSQLIQVTAVSKYPIGFLNTDSVLKIKTQVPPCWIHATFTSVDCYPDVKHICRYLLHVCSVQFRSSVVSNSLWPHELQHARPPCPSPTPGVHSNSCPSSWWCHPAISSSVVPFSSCSQSLPASEIFQWVNSSHEVAKVLEFQL